jgi:hypothetical protein
MRWNKIEIGETRWRKVFCFRPRAVKNQMVWLEWIWLREEYLVYYGKCNWFEREAMVKEEYLKRQNN